MLTPKVADYSVEFAQNQVAIKTLAGIMFTKIAGDTH